MIGLQHPSPRRKTLARRNRQHRVDWDQLDVRQRLFTKFYIIHLGNATRAAQAAGYTGDVTHRGMELLQRPHIRRIVDMELARRLQPLDVKADRVLLQLARVAFADVRELIGANGKFKRPREIDRDTAAAISAFETGHDGRFTKIRLRDSVAALELLGSWLGLWKGKGDESGKDRLQEVVDALREVQ